ncbi:MAG: hypothetical protein KY475_21775 [Planctomycetes bacterium]|nr:hypothetical protein [Planctomycetota bacterium]
MTAREALYALGPRHTIDVLDPSPWCQCRFSSLVRRWRRCPSYNQDPEAYLDFLVKLLQTGEYDVLLPTHEQIYLVSRFKDLITPHVGVAVADFDALARLQSKAEFARLLDELELPAPATLIVRNRAELEHYDEFPYYVKIDFSTAGNGVRRVENADELRRVADEFESAGWLDGRNEVVLQRPAKGVQCSASAIFQHGRLVGVFDYHVRRPGVGGWNMNGVSVHHPIVYEHMRRVGEHLSFHGTFFADYFYDRQTGRPEYIEANPRLGPTFYAQLCGSDFGEQIVRLSLGEEVEPLPTPQEGVRSHQAFLMRISFALEGATRRRLLGEVWRSLRKQGVYHDSENLLTRPRADWMSVLPATGVTTLLLAAPSAAKLLYRNTVGNFSLPETAARNIRELAAAGPAPHAR